jgi:hypothetical protein
MQKAGSGKGERVKIWRYGLLALLGKKVILIFTRHLKVTYTLQKEEASYKTQESFGHRITVDQENTAKLLR